tara:strand:+ start:258 stop:827 length:570 start_codon:yes stop_codon:yes gene_type:complete
MRYITITGFMVACLLAVYNGQAFAGEDDFKIKTGVYVRGEENINGLIENYIGKELGSLGNVIVTYSQLDCAIDVVVKKLTDDSSAKGGYVLSVTIIDRFDSSLITRAIEELDTIIPRIKAQPIVIKQLEELSAELVGIAINTAKIKSFHNSSLYTGSEGQLRELCFNIVADFNNGYLKEKRKMIQRRYY